MIVTLATRYLSETVWFYTVRISFVYIEYKLGCVGHDIFSMADIFWLESYDLVAATWPNSQSLEFEWQMWMVGIVVVNISTIYIFIYSYIQCTTLIIRRPRTGMQHNWRSCLLVCMHLLFFKFNYHISGSYQHLGCGLPYRISAKPLICYDFSMLTGDNWAENATVESRTQAYN